MFSYSKITRKHGVIESDSVVSKIENSRLNNGMTAFEIKHNSHREKLGMYFQKANLDYE